MKSSSHTSDFLSQQQLEAYLNGTLDPSAKSKVEELLNDCELSKEALAGYSAFPAAIGDIAGLKNQIAAKSGMGVSKIWLNVLAGTVAVAVIATAYYFLKPTEKNPVAEIPQTKTALVQNPPVNTEPAMVLTPQAEHFVNPESKPESPATIAAAKKDSAANKLTPENNPQSLPVSEPPVVEVKPVVPANPEPGYNASVGFILDLKITEYEKYKDQVVKVNVPQLRGLSAQYESYDVQSSEYVEDSVRKIPADFYLREGLKSFRDGRYGRCIEKMEVLRKNNANDLNAAFYMGVSYVKLEMHGKAIPLLDQILNSPNNVFHEEARWYKALALLGNGQTEAGNKLLNEIANADGFYQSKAKVMLGK